MTRYLKYENGHWIEAPKRAEKDGMTIIGYNSPQNEQMLLADGWMRYDGNKDLNHLRFDNGSIIEIEDQIVEEPKHIFTKLQIRRAMRKLNMEDQLDYILSSSAEVQKDWNDALQIDLYDEVFNEALTLNGLSGDFIQTIIDTIEE